MTEHVYPKLPNSTYMEDKLEHLKKELARYKKIKSKWTVANTTLRICGISVDQSISWSFSKCSIFKVSLLLASFWQVFQ